MSSGTGGNYPAPVIAGENTGINAAFQPFPYPNTTDAANAAYNNIISESNPGAVKQLSSAGLNAINYGMGLPAQLAPIAQQGLQAGQAQYNTLAPYVTRALQAGFDPQNALYNQQFGQQREQNLAAQAMAGVGQSPYGAGLTAQGNTNFNLNWQNQELARQQMGAQTAGGLSSGAMNALSGGINDYLGATGLGISGMQGLLGAGGNAMAQAQGLTQSQVQQLLAYLQASTANAQGATGQQISALNAGTSLFDTLNTGNYNQQLLTDQALAGAGKAAGTLAGFAFL